MARYIDADALIAKGWRLERHAPSGMVISEMSIADVPTADVVEVRRGEWEYYSTTMMKCNVCERHTPRHRYEFCPHCGARMDGDEDDL